MERLANSIADVAGYGVAKAVAYAKRVKKPLLLLPETFFVDPLSRRQDRLAVYAVDGDFVFQVKTRCRQTDAKWLYTDCAYLIDLKGKVYKIGDIGSDAIDP